MRVLGSLLNFWCRTLTKIVATDLSASQLQHAPYFENVSYQVQTAESNSFPAQCFDLITVAQAIHWFDFDAFYAQVRRTLKPDGVFAVVGYGLLQVNEPQLNDAIQKLYSVTLKNFWDAERHYIDEGYQTIPFPFQEIEMPAFKIQLQWSFQQFINYLHTWSAVKHYMEQNGIDPIDQIESLYVDDQLLNIEFPVLLRVGKLE